MVPKRRAFLAPTRTNRCHGQGMFLLLMNSAGRETVSLKAGWICSWPSRPQDQEEGFLRWCAEWCAVQRNPRGVHDKQPLQLGHPINIREFYYQGYLLDYFAIGLKKIMLNCKPWVVWVWCGHPWAESNALQKLDGNPTKLVPVGPKGSPCDQCWPRSWMYAFLFRNFTSRYSYCKIARSWL